MKRKILSLVLCLAMLVSLAACGGSSEEQAPASDTDSSTEQIVIKISHQNAITHPTQKGLEKFKELLEERSGGTMTCDIYDSAVLGNDTSNLQQVIAGSLDAAMIMGADIWQGYDKRAMIENLPFMFSTYEEVGHGASWIPGDVRELLAVDMGCVGTDLSCTETDVSICAKDSGGPYDYQMTSRLIELAQAHQLPYAVDIYPFYGSDCGAALKGGNDIRGALIGPGVHASHGMERTHMQGVSAAYTLLAAYLLEK